MTAKNLPLNKALQDDESFLVFLTQESRNTEFLKMKQAVESGPHPSDEMLYKYVLGELPDDETEYVHDHIAFCTGCIEDVLRMRSIEGELETGLAAWMKAEEVPKPRSMDWTERITKLASRSSHVVIWLTALWEPQWTTAAMNEQQHVFETEDGIMNVSCSWRAQHNTRPAYINISWKANMTMPGEFWVRFENPESNETLAELLLGAHLKGEETFTSHDLGFNPSTQRWAIALVLKEAAQ